MNENAYRFVRFDDDDVMSKISSVAFHVHRRGYWMTPPTHMPRLAHMDALCSLCRIARGRGNGWAFSYSMAEYAPRGVA